MQFSLQLGGDSVYIPAIRHYDNKDNYHIYHIGKSLVPGSHCSVYLADSVNESLCLEVEDCTHFSGEQTIITIHNFNNKPLTVNVWDRRAIRHPHVDFTYNGVFYDGMNGKDITI